MLDELSPFDTIASDGGSDGRRQREKTVRKKRPRLGENFTKGQEEERFDHRPLGLKTDIRKQTLQNTQSAPCHLFISYEKNKRKKKKKKKSPGRLTGMMRKTAGLAVAAVESNAD